MTDTERLNWILEEARYVELSWNPPCRCSWNCNRESIGSRETIDALMKRQKEDPYWNGDVSHA